MFTQEQRQKELSTLERESRLHENLGTRFLNLAKSFSFKGHYPGEHQEALGKCLIQCLLKHSLDEMIRSSFKSEDDDLRLKLSHCTFDFKEKKITVTQWAFLKELAKGLIYVMVVFSATLIMWATNTLIRRPKKKSFSLFEGIPQNKLNDRESLKELKRFLSERFPELLGKENIVKGMNAGLFFENFTVYRFPLIQHHLYTISGGDLLFYLEALFRSIIFFIKNIFSHPGIIYLHLDFIRFSIASWMNKRGLVKDVIVTDSSQIYRPFWMFSLDERKFIVSHLWYSSNNRSFFQYENQGKRCHPPMCALPLMSYDRGYYWTKNQAEWFSSFLPRHEIKITGPNIFELFEGNQPRDHNITTHPLNSVEGKQTVVLFDVIPKKRPLGIFNYYRLEIMERFFQDILEEISCIRLSQDISIEVVLKSKRKESPDHDDPRYRGMVNSFTKAYDFFSVLSAETKLYPLISRADVCISIPYTSPVHIASEMGKQGLFYDPTKILDPIYNEKDGLEFCGGKDQLRSFFNRFFQRPSSWVL